MSSSRCTCFLQVMQIPNVSSSHTSIPFSQRGHLPPENPTSSPADSFVLSSEIFFFIPSSIPILPCPYLPLQLQSQDSFFFIVLLSPHFAHFFGLHLPSCSSPQLSHLNIAIFTSSFFYIPGNTRKILYGCQLFQKPPQLLWTNSRGNH